MPRKLAHKVKAMTAADARRTAKATVHSPDERLLS
jgi:hypothetical protein